MMGMTNPETVHYGMWDGSSIVICAYALTLILITLKRKEFPHVFILFVPVSVIFLAVLYFPGVYSHLPYTYDEGRRQIFRRVRWMLMMLPVLTFGMTYLFSHMKTKQKLITGFLFGLLMLASVFYTSDGQEEYGFWDRTNAQDHLYKIPKVSKAMGDTIINLSGDYLAQDRENTVTLLISDDGENEWEDSMDYKVKQMNMYLAPVEYTNVVITKEAYSKPGFRLDDVVQERYDYVLCPEDEEIASLYKKKGYDVLWSMDGMTFMGRSCTTVGSS